MIGKKMDNIKPRAALVVLLVSLFLGSTILYGGDANGATTLTIEDTRRIAVEFNRSYLAAIEDLAKAESEVTVARSGALPEISLDSDYSRNLKIPSAFLSAGGETIEFKTGFKNNFSTTISARQSLWQGGKVYSALKVAKLYKGYAMAGLDAVKAEVILNAELLFYTAVLRRSNLEALDKAFEAASANLEVVEMFHGQGLVSEYELLRARVEKANLLPQLLEAESNVRLARKQLKSFLGIELNEEVHLIDGIDNPSSVSSRGLDDLIREALDNRPEMKQAEAITEITRRAIGIAKADYMPSVEAVSAYNWSSQSDEITLDKNNSRSWSAGINLSFPIFNGGETRGRVKNARADHQQARLFERDTRDAIRLEVEQAFDRMEQAKKSVEIQSETIAQAEEGLKIANLRYESGVGTQLEILSAQAALTEARNALAAATFSFRQARSQLRKATTFSINDI